MRSGRACCGRWWRRSSEPPELKFRLHTNLVHRSPPTANRRPPAALFPPLREMRARPTRVISVVAHVVEQHQAGADRILEVEHVQTGGRLVESIAVAARIEAQQAADHQADRGLV